MESEEIKRIMRDIMNRQRLLTDMEYMFLNQFVRFIPAYCVRRFFYIKCGMRIGENSRIGYGTIVINPSKIKIGKRTIINEYCHLDGRAGIQIGNDSSISVSSMIITGTHIKDSKDFKYCEQKVTIADRVWLGSRAIILNGSYIQDEAIIGAGCVFKGIAKRGKVYIGNPAVCKGDRMLKGKYKLDYHPCFR